jgi:hypothetical protein
MIGKAGTWVTTLAKRAGYDDSARDILATWPTFRAELIRRWAQRKTPEALATLVRGLVMKSSETMEDFWDRCYEASIEVNYRRTDAEMATALFRSMQCEFMQLHCIDGLPTAVRNALPALKENINMADLRDELIKAYEKVKRDGIKMGAATKDGSRPKEIANVDLSDNVANLTKKFAKWATNLEKSNKLESATFSVAQALTGQQPKVEVAAVAANPGAGQNPGRGRGRGRGRGGRGGGNTGGLGSDKSGIACWRCNLLGHCAYECTAPAPVARQQGVGPGFGRGAGGFNPGVSSISYAQAAQYPPQGQGQFQGQQCQSFAQQQQRPGGPIQGGQAGSAPLFNSQWDFPQ